MKKTIPIPVTIFVILGGLMTIALGIITLPSTIRLVKNGIVTEGEIIGETLLTGDKKPGFVVEYLTEDGVIYEGEFFASNFSSDADIGDKVQIIYQKDNPKNSQQNKFLSIYGFQVIGAGGLLMVIIFVIIVISQKNKNEERNKKFSIKK